MEGFEPPQGRFDPFRFALGKSRCCKGIGAKEISSYGTRLRHCEEQIDLFLHGEEITDLLKK